MFGIFKSKSKPKAATKPKKINNHVKEVDHGDQLSSNDVMRAINQMQKDLDKLKNAVTGGVVPTGDNQSDQIVEQAINEIKDRAGEINKSESEKVVEGVFDGQAMVGSDGQVYDVPANYASKSKLVEGDILKLTVNNMGAFVYKQIKPIERIRKVGQLEQDPQSLQFYAVEEGKKWRLLTASVTYYKGESGDEIVFLIPAESGSRWAAVENIVKK